MNPGMFDNAYKPDVESVRAIMERLGFDPDLDKKIAAARKATDAMPDVVMARTINDLLSVADYAIKQAKELGI